MSLETLKQSQDAKIDAGILLSTPPARNLTTRLNGLEVRMLVAASLGQQVSDLMLDLLEVAEGAQPMDVIVPQYLGGERIRNRYYGYRSGARRGD